jgi:hypothetical protein
LNAFVFSEDNILKFLWLIGAPAVGKMTVGQELAKITDLRLFHNHMTIEPVIEIFGYFNKSAIKRLRDVIFEEYAKTDNYGLIFTFLWAFDMQGEKARLESYYGEISIEVCPYTQKYLKGENLL